MKTILILLLIVGAISGCANKPSCANGAESFRPVLDPAASCKVRIRQVVVGSDANIPNSISFANDGINWSYKWVDTEFKDGQLVLGHMTLQPQVPNTAGDKN